MARKIRDPKLDRLSRTDLFRHCSVRQLQEVGRLVDETTRPAGTILARAGHATAEVLFVTEGRLAAYRDGERVGHGVWAVGQVSVEASRSHEHTVVAETDVTLLVADPRSYRALVDVLPALHVDAIRMTEASPHARALSHA